MNKEKLLEVEKLNIKFLTSIGDVNVSENINFHLKRGEIFCIVGESGCGKSVVALSLTRLLPENAMINGSIKFEGVDIANLEDKEFAKIRGRKIATIFEQPMSCINPVMRIGNQIAETYRANFKCSKKEAKEQALKKLKEVKLPINRYNSYPHELSGGMQQRVMIAIALACNPQLLIADEPTTSLDVTVQYQILELLQEIKEKYNMAILMITHDMAVVHDMADTIGVMYAGNMMEIAARDAFFQQPLHPYAQELLNVVKDPCNYTIPGTVPNLMESFLGCPFEPRCNKSTEICKTKKPEDIVMGKRIVRCLNVVPN
ncbi:ATP-binding cassette domain-containing protein [Acetobacterium paludosum]|uniref:ATP-binding cassette domain-containing protein n=1 Tax=Acetobacterium paludosum TaxID=52693 RepID=A0A923HYR4_9FIRM|nr:ABC transporter ATP-binding protein [Acetobacterium paludosum]MBC3889074.1 ATP-binding cassette domain-containing protein [Acetobacterium paludosum]